MTKTNVTPLVPAAVAMQAPLAVPQHSMRDLCEMAQAFVSGGMFGVSDVHQALSLLMIAQANGQHPAKAMQDYDIVFNRPAKKAEAMLRDFLAAGGKVEWHELSDTRADATFSHPQGGTQRFDWDIGRARQAGLVDKSGSMWKKYPRPMLRSRVISEGVKTIYPAATSGMYVPEEVRDFDDRSMKDVTPPAEAEPEAEPADLEEAKSVARLGAQPFRDWWTSRRKSQNAPLMPYLDDLQGLAEVADTDTTGFDATPPLPSDASETGDADPSPPAASPAPSDDPYAIPAHLKREPKPKTVERVDDATGEAYQESMEAGS